MGFLGGLFGKRSASDADFTIAAPAIGKCVSIKKVPDSTFSDEILGKGVAIIPADNRLLAPCDGKIDLIFPTGHAVSIISDFGAEILIHIGLETVSLKGAGFKTYVSNGDIVKKGDLLIELDRDFIQAQGFNIITPMVVCNGADFSGIESVTGADVTNDDVVIKLHK